MTTLADIQHAAVECARKEWERAVRDPQDADRIAHYHRETGADWALDEGEYEEHEDFWCGVFAGFCYSRVGRYLLDDQCVELAMRERITAYLFPSTSRLAGKWKAWRDFADVAAPVVVDPKEVRAGDIPVVRTGRTDRTWGDHVTLARGPLEDGQIPTFEGNTVGPLGDDTRGEGVVRDVVLVENVAAIYRPRLSYFAGEFASEIEE